jgi:transposase InsO family protein
MTQSGDPLENAIAERANGILKSEWLYKMTIPTRAECKVILERIIGFYNNERPHMSIGWQTPGQAHHQMGEQQRCWKNYYHTSAPPVSTPDTQQPVETEREAIAV